MALLAQLSDIFGNDLGFSGLFLVQKEMTLWKKADDPRCSRTRNKYIKLNGDFPGGAVVKNPPANAGDTGLSPGPGRSRMQLSPCSTTTEPVLQSQQATTADAWVPRAHALQQEKPPQWEARCAPQQRVASTRRN